MYRMSPQLLIAAAGTMVSLGVNAEVAFGETLDQKGNALAIDSLDNIVVVGNFEGSFSFCGNALSSGGKLTADPVGEGETMGFKLTADGPNSRVPPHAEHLLAGTPEQTLDAHHIQPFYAGMIARAAGLAVSIAKDGETVVLTAK